jgi:Beta protein
LHASLESIGVPNCPVIGYDRWDDITYQEAIGSITLDQGRYFCIRLDSDALNDIADFEYFSERINEILLKTGSSSSECAVLLDLADVTQQSIEDMLEQVDGSVPILKNMGFEKIVLAGSSIPTTINEAVKTTETEGYLQRKEMLAWRSLYQTFPELIFGDYGVRSPRANEQIIAPDTNGKIRYSTKNNFFIARGYSLRTRDKGAQNHALATKIINSRHYLGPTFSWGDLRIQACANREFRGNSTNWISIDTNHHIEAVLVEIAEYMSERIAAKVA